MMTMETNSRTAQRSRDLRTAQTLTETALTNSGRTGDLKIMNLVVFIDSLQMFFRHFGLRHLNAALGFVIGLAVPNAGQKIIARFARRVEWLRARLRPQVPEMSIAAQLHKQLEVCRW